MNNLLTKNFQQFVPKCREKKTECKAGFRRDKMLRFSCAKARNVGKVLHSKEKGTFLEKPALNVVFARGNSELALVD